MSGALHKRRLRQADYTIACIVSMAVELAPLQAILDDLHEQLALERPKNAYVLGSLKHHNIVIAQLSDIGNNGSGPAANQLLNDFPSICFGLLVGIAGGIPGASGSNDIRLGDVVVSVPFGTSGGVLQFDRGKQHAVGGFEIAGHLNRPPDILLSTVQKLRAEHEHRDNRIHDFICQMLRKEPQMAGRYSRPLPDHDRLYEAMYHHQSAECAGGCDPSRLIHRPDRSLNQVVIHYGIIGSSNPVMRDAIRRDQLRDDFNNLAVEMESAGLMNVIPCLVIRGICDYADSHKSKEWQPYAAAAAAVYARELLLAMTPGVHGMAITSDHDTIARLSYSGSDQRAKGLPYIPASHVADPTYKVLLDSLKFERMNARARNVLDAMPKTCKWIFKNKQYLHGLTAVKFTNIVGFVDQRKARDRQIYHYEDNMGSSEERSAPESC